ncbi:MAG: SH3 domain-containing protein [Anaerolineae bacterium]|nr:SH3 domain-containing protein [Anaerolineae bacterium]
MVRIWIAVLWCLGLSYGLSLAQVRMTATPLRVVIPTATSQPTEFFQATSTPTWTPTPVGPVQLRTRADSGEVNVRAEPDPSSQRLGTVKPRQEYVVRGRYYNWLWIDFSESPSGTGWVYDALVEIVGDNALISSVDPYAEPTAMEASSNTAGTTTLGVEGQSTQDERLLILPTNVATESFQRSEGMLPTFTPVAVLPEGLSPLVQIAPSQSQPTGGVPPIFPVAALIGSGVLGLVVSAMRR